MDVFFYWRWWVIERYNGIWNKVNNSIKKKLDCEPIYNKKFLKTKISCYGDETTDFQDKEVPKVDSNYTCLALILLDSIFKKHEK